MSLPNPLGSEEKKNSLLTVYIHCRRLMSTIAASRRWDGLVCLLPRPLQPQSMTEGQSIAVAYCCEPSFCDAIEDSRQS